MRPTHRAVLTAALLSVALGACAGRGGGATPAPEADARAATARPAEPWSIKTREHVDLWLHGFALLAEDTARVPWFRVGYADAATVEKNRLGVTTKLDAHRDSLRRRLAGNPDLVNAQFAALYFGSWQDMKEGFRWFEMTEGNPRRASSEYQARIIAFYANLFPTPNDRVFAKRLFEALEDEHAKWWRAWWTGEQRARARRLAQVDSQWRATWRPALLPLLEHSNLRAGDLVLAIPLEAEGRTVNAGSRQNVVAVPFPAADERPEAVAWVFVHEAVSGIVSSVVNDNTTPAEKRAGVADRMTSDGVVRAGHLVLERILPSLADGYARYYLAALERGGPDARERVRVRLAGVQGAALKSELERAFPLPATMAEAVARQVELILGGI